MEDTNTHLRQGKAVEKMIGNFRDHAANERPCHAWIRTAVALMG